METYLLNFSMNFMTILKLKKIQKKENFWKKLKMSSEDKMFRNRYCQALKIPHLII